MYFRKEVNMKNKQDVRSKFLQELGKLTNDNNQFLQVLGLVDEYIEKLYKHELKIADDRWKQTEKELNYYQMKYEQDEYIGMADWSKKYNRSWYCSKCHYRLKVISIEPLRYVCPNCGELDIEDIRSLKELVEDIKFDTDKLLNKSSMFRKIKNFIQRGKKGYSEEDLWNLDCYLGELAYNSIKDFRATERTGYPMTAESKEKWEKILKQLEEGLSLYDKIDMVDYVKDGKFDSEEYQKVMKKYEKSWRLLSKWILGLWD